MRSGAHVSARRGLAAFPRMPGLWVSMVAACGPAPDAPPADAEAGLDAPDAPHASPDTNAGCHWDCFRARFCAAGVVHEVVHAPVPCDRWTGSCPTTALGTCPFGCGDRAPIADVGGWEVYCEGTEQRLAGDPCETDADCQPPAPEVTPTALERRYLACDGALESCVAAAPPSAPDAGGACAVSFDALSSVAGGYAYGVVADAACSSGWCLFLAAEAPACDLHGCATVCEDDWDCPPDLECLARQDWTGRRLEDGALPDAVRVCTRALIDANAGLRCQ